MQNFYRLFVCVSIALLIPYYGSAQRHKTDKKLQKKLEALCSGFQGDIGIYVFHLKKQREVAIRADTIFPTASIVKVPILVGIFSKIKAGELDYREPLMYDEKRAYGGSGIMQFFKDSTKTDLSTAISLMISYSDNTASLWCQELAGGGAAINKLMAQYGLEHTRVNSRTPGREKIWERYGWGQTTPREMSRLLVQIREGKVIDPAYSERMYRHMSHIYYDENALSKIPPYIQTASKQGAVDASRSELVMVNAPHGDYVFYVGTKNNRDTSWTSNNEAQQLIRKISETIWHHYEPADKWEPDDTGTFL